jgi:hypothetical protein
VPILGTLDIYRRGKPVMRIKKAAMVGAGALVAAITLSGCLATESDVYIGSEAQITSVENVLTVNKFPVSIGGGIETPAVGTLDEFKESVNSELSGSTMSVEDFCTYGETDTAFTLSCKFNEGDIDGVPLSELLAVDDENGFVTELKDGNVVVTLQTTAADPIATSLGFTSQTRIHMPAEISSVTGTGVSKVSAQVALVDANLTDGGQIVITSPSGDEDPMFSVAVIIVSVFSIAVLAFLGAWMLASKRRNADPAPTEPETPATDVEETQ